MRKAKFWSSGRQSGTNQASNTLVKPAYQANEDNARPEFIKRYFYRLCNTRDSLTTSALGIA
jgi:hypothetical protein